MTGGEENDELILVVAIQQRGFLTLHFAFAFAFASAFSAAFSAFDNGVGTGVEGEGGGDPAPGDATGVDIPF